MFSLHRSILNRLILVWVVLSVLCSGVVFWYQTEEMEDFILELATRESAVFTEYMFETHSTDIQQKTEALLKKHFVVVEVYTKRKQSIYETVRPDMARIESELKKYKHGFPKDKKPLYKKFYFQNNLFFQVMIPLYEKQESGVYGYFEGVYQVDPLDVARLKNNLFQALLIVLAAITLTSGILYPIILPLWRKQEQLSRQLIKTNLDLMEVLGAAIAKRDSDTHIHNYRVTLYAVWLGEQLNIEPLVLQDLIAGAFLHDVGKIGIPDRILLKPGKLDEEEFSIMRTHVSLGVDILSRSPWLKGAMDVVEYHHEKFNGQGYMKGLAGEAIPLNARIFAIVDVFDALTSRRPYKEPFPLEKALSILKQDAGTHFDPTLVSVFCEHAEAWLTQLRRLSEPEIETLLIETVEKYYF